MPEIEIDTPRGLARAHLTAPPSKAAALLMLGHGAGGGVQAPDLRIARAAGLDLQMAVALIEQPYRVAGRRSPAPAPALDEAWAAVAAHLTADELPGVPLVTGGRSSGARVACRTAAATGAIGVLCLAFPLQPPARAGAARVAPSRLPELEAVEVPVLIVQGERDRFGLPPAASRRTVITIAGDHGLKSDAAGLRQAVSGWLAELVPGAR